MRTVALINPNSSTATTATLTAIAQQALGPRYHVHGITARTGPALIQTEAALRNAAHEVLTITRQLITNQAAPDAVIVAAFGDPAVDDIRRTTAIGIAEAAIREASAHGRRFGIATTTPGLVDAITAKIAALGAQPSYTGIRLTQGDLERLLTAPDLLHQHLLNAARACVHLDHADAVIIGGGPLAAAAEHLHAALDVPVIAPVPAACRAIHELLTRAR
jgi:allantoin racemase